MRAAVLREVGGPLTIEEIGLARPQGREVLIRVAASGLCHSDLRFIEGSFPLPLPAVLGHEAAGIVLGVGDEVTHVGPGDHVVTSISVFCGECLYCMSKRPQLCLQRDVTGSRAGGEPRLARNGEAIHQLLNLGAFAEEMLVHENAVVRITREMPLDKAALFGCGVATGLGAVFNTASIRKGETVAILGCGGVGLSAVQAARIIGAGQIIAVDRVAGKLAAAHQLGATDLVNAGEGDPVSTVRELTGGGVDHAIEAIGATTTVEQAFAMLRRGGTATVVGLIPMGQVLQIPADELYWERRIQGSVMGSNRFRIDTPRYVDMYLDGRLDLDGLITERLDLGEINRGFARMAKGLTARSLIVFDGYR